MKPVRGARGGAVQRTGVGRRVISRRSEETSTSISSRGSMGRRPRPPRGREGRARRSEESSGRVPFVAASTELGDKEVNPQEEEEKRVEDFERAQERSEDPFEIGKLSVLASMSASIYSRRDIEAQKLVEITSSDEPDPNDPTTLQGTVYDPLMGKSSFSKRCLRCDEGINCPKHLGWIDFGYSPDQRQGTYVDPFLVPATGPVVKSILNIVCRACGTTTFTREDLVHWGLTKAPLERRVTEVEKRMKSRLESGDIKCVMYDFDEYLDIGDDQAGSTTTTSGRTAGTGRYKKKPHPGCREAIEEVKYDKKENIITLHGNAMNTTEIKRILELITPNEAALLGFRTNIPTDLLMSFVIVLPPSMRETVLIAAEEKRFDYLGQAYRQIIKKKNEIREQRLSKNDSAKIAVLTKSIHDTIAQILSLPKGKAGYKRGAVRGGGQDQKGIKQEISGKDGLIRHFMMGKRLDKSTRSVITPNPRLRFGYFQLPAVNMNGQFMDIPITSWNIDILQELFDAGELVHYVFVKDYYRRRRFTISKLKYPPQLSIGDYVSCSFNTLVNKLKRQDRPSLGRNPTIHHLGIMSVRVAPADEKENNTENTTKLHPSYCTPYNGDFDGDEMHEEYPQEIYSQAEARYVSNIERCIMNSENSGASMGGVMDVIRGIYEMVSPQENGYVRVTEDQLEFLLSQLTWRRDLRTLDKRLKKYNIDKYSGRGVISALFPATFNYERDLNGNLIVIKDGILISGTLGKGQIGPAKNSFVQFIYHYYSPYRAAYFINDLSIIGNLFLSKIKGATVGLKDTAHDNEIIPAIAGPNLARIYETIMSIDKPTPDPLESQRRESDIIALIQGGGQALDGKLTREALAGPNAFGNMYRSGAKGDAFHLRQMVARGAGMGQNFLLNARLPKDMTNGTRGDPYSHPDDNNPETKGYERKTLTEGMSPQGTVSHMKATRGNLIDMTSKTADAGEDHHLKNKMLIDAKVDYLSSTRDTNGVVMEFVTGHVGLDPMHIVTVKNDNKTVEFYVDIGVLVDEAISAVLWDLDEEQDYLTANPILQEDQ